MKYVSKNIEQLINSNIKIKIRNLKFCGKIYDKFGVVKLFFRDEKFNFYILQYDTFNNEFISFLKVEYIRNFDDVINYKMDNFDFLTIEYEKTKMNFKILNGISKSLFSKFIFIYKYYDYSKKTYVNINKNINNGSTKMPNNLQVYLKLDSEQFLNII